MPATTPVYPSTAARPIFVVGSPRSGTSILTWCLGQHSNILALEESNWMAPFAVDLAVAHRRGASRGERSQFSSMGIERDQFMGEIGQRVNETILHHRIAFEDRRRALARPDAPGRHPAFHLSRDDSDPKSRWVNGTPEYSLGIGGLRKLFPEARFVHILRDCDQVVTSMLHFERVAGTKLIATEDKGYQHWLTRVRACVMAERAYGPTVVRRLLHEDLLRQPEESIRGILGFVDEPFESACLEPLQKRINSSRPEEANAVRHPPADERLVSEARELWQSLRSETRTAPAPDPEAAAGMDEQFERRVDYIFELDAHHAQTQHALRQLQREFEDRTRWALRLNEEIEVKNRRIVKLQEELAERTRWAQNLLGEIAQKDSRILRLQEECDEGAARALKLRDETERTNAP